MENQIQVSNTVAILNNTQALSLTNDNDYNATKENLTIKLTEVKNELDNIQAVKDSIREAIRKLQANDKLSEFTEKQKKLKSQIEWNKLYNTRQAYNDSLASLNNLNLEAVKNQENYQNLKIEIDKLDTKLELAVNQYDKLDNYKDYLIKNISGCNNILSNNQEHIRRIEDLVQNIKKIDINKVQSYEDYTKNN
jgi:chromosome segregation ATPase